MKTQNKLIIYQNKIKKRCAIWPFVICQNLKCHISYSNIFTYLDLHLEIDSEGQLRTKLYDTRDDFNFTIVIIPFICSNIPTAPAYGVYISQLTRYSRYCCSYQNLLDRGLLLTRCYWTNVSSWLSWSHHFESFTVAPMTLLTVMEYVSQMTTDMFHLSWTFPGHFLIHDL